MKKYENLKKAYPNYVSLDQLCAICKISKRSARYLVENKIIPAIDTGKKTWRYQIAVDDVIAYLCQRKQCGSMIPAGAVSSRTTRRRRSYSQAVTTGQEKEIVKYFAYVYSDYPDVLTINDMVDMTGLHKKSFHRILSDGHIKILASSPRYLITMASFLKFIGSRRFIDIWSNSESFVIILDGFEAWKSRQN